MVNKEKIKVKYEYNFEKILKKIQNSKISKIRKFCLYNIKQNKFLKKKSEINRKLQQLLFFHLLCGVILKDHL